MNSPAKSSAPRTVVPVIDLGAEYRSLKAKINPVLQRVLASGSYILGDETRRLEEAIAAYCETRYAIGVNSGTDAIYLALRALDIGPGHEVIVPAMTFIATAEPISRLGARPVFADIDPRTFNIDPKQVEAKITPRTKAIVAVHLYGQPADMDALLAIGKSHSIPVIEDMAQAIGSTYKGRKAGSLGTMACLSFYPTKNLGAAGDGGMIVTSDENLAFRLQRLRNHGARVKYDHEELGCNSRLDEIQAAILRVKLTMLDRWNQKRAAYAAEYSKGLTGLPFHLPFKAPDRTHVYHLYSLRVSRRDDLRNYLSQEGIQTAMHYPKPLHLQAAFRGLAGKLGDFPHSERLANETLSLPLHAQLSRGDIRRVIKVVRQFYAHG